MLVKRRRSSLSCCSWAAASMALSLSRAHSRAIAWSASPSRPAAFSNGDSFQPMSLAQSGCPQSRCVRGGRAGRVVRFDSGRAGRGALGCDSRHAARRNRQRCQEQRRQAMSKYSRYFSGNALPPDKLTSRCPGNFQATLDTCQVFVMTFAERLVGVDDSVGVW